MRIDITDTLSIAPHEIEERFVRASGPGGQNVNKVATAVELRFALGASALPARVKQRVRTLAGHRLIDGDVVLIDSREYRTQAQNRVAARERLIALVAEAARPVKARRPTAPGKAARERRLDVKKQHSVVKARRRRVTDAD